VETNPNLAQSVTKVQSSWYSDCMDRTFTDIDKQIQALKTATSRWSTTDQSRVTQAIIFARTKHAGQTYVPANEYAIHPIRAARTLAELGTVEPDVILATILHDTLEDTNTSEDEITAAFGERVTTLVKMVSHRFAEDSTLEEKVAAKRDNHTEIQRGPIEARLIKCADQLDQMRNWKRLPSSSPIKKKLLRFLEEAQSYALPLAEETEPKLADLMRRELHWYYVHIV